MRYHIMCCVLCCVLFMFCITPCTYSAEKSRWEDITSQFDKKSNNIVLTDYYNIYNPAIVKINDDKEYPYRMFPFGWATTKDMPTGDKIYTARSQDMLNWEVYIGEGRWKLNAPASQWQPVIVPDKANKYGNAAVGDPSVVYKDGKFYMAFSSVGAVLGNPDDKVMGIYYITNNVKAAVSVDGINWEVNEKPILIWDREETVKVKVYDHTPAENYYGSYHRPSLMWDKEEKMWKIWFDYFYPGYFLVMGYAENNGYFSTPNDWKLKNFDRNPQMYDWPNPSVVKVGKYYYSVCDSPCPLKEKGGDGRQLVFAVSTNGKDWDLKGTVYPETPRFSSHVPQFFVEESGTNPVLWLFYSWAPTTVGSSDPEFGHYKGIKWIKKELSADGGWK